MDASYVRVLVCGLYGQSGKQWMHHTLEYWSVGIMVSQVSQVSSCSLVKEFSILIQILFFLCISTPRSLKQRT